MDDINQTGRIVDLRRDLLTEIASCASHDKSRLLGVIIGHRAIADPEAWRSIAHRIGALRPSFAILLPFLRTNPELLPAYFGESDRVQALLEDCHGAERVLVAHAHRLAATAELTPIVELTADENLRVRLYELTLIARPSIRPTILKAVSELRLREPEAISALAFLLLEKRCVSAERLPQDWIVGWSEDQKRAFFWRFLEFLHDRKLAPFADPASAFRLKLTSEERSSVMRLQMPGQLSTLKYAGPHLLRELILRTGVAATAWFDVSLTLPQLPQLTTVQAWTTLVRFTLGGFGSEDYLSRAETLALMTHRFGATGIMHLYEHFGVRSLFEHNLENGPRSSKRILRDFSKRYPDILPPQVLETVDAFTGDRDTFINLINEYLLKSSLHADAGIADLVAAAFDVPHSVACALTARESGRRLMAVLSEFKKSHDTNLLSTIAFTEGERPDLSALDGYVYELRNAFILELAIRTTRRAGRMLKKSSQRRMFERLFLLQFGADKLPVERIVAAREILRSEATGRINTLLELQEGGERFDVDDVTALERDWCDIEPAVTTLARLSYLGLRGRCSKDAARLVLQTIKASCDGRFSELKFDETEARRQLDFMTSRQLAAWRAPRALVRIGGSGRPDNRPRLEELAARLASDLDCLSEGRGFDPAEVSAELRAEISELAREEIKADPAFVVERAIAAHEPFERTSKVARSLIGEMAQPLWTASADRIDQRNAARVVQALVRVGFATSRGSDAYQRVITDLRAIEREIPKDLLDGETISQGIVATAFDCSPRLMLAIGDMVNTACCLSYQSGGRIGVLPAYVIDANIQAMLSWQLKQTHFASVQDYKAVLNALVAGQRVAAAFSGDRLQFHFTFSRHDRQETIATSRLGFAHLRQIIRLGRAREGFYYRPGLLAEREYAQPHPLQHLMQSNHADLMRRLALEIGAIDKRPIKFPKSRNPDGVYCDAVGGVRLFDYTVY